MKLRSIIIVLSLLVLAGCRGNSEFLHYLNDKPVTAKETYQVQDISGGGHLDILWIIDNSGSMDPYQKKVIENTDIFIDTLTKYSSLKWKLGLLSTDDSLGPYHLGFGKGKEIEYTTSDAAEQFKQAVRGLGVYGNATETGYDVIFSMLDDHPDFLRPSAKLAIILVSDAPLQSWHNYKTKDLLNRLERAGKDKGKLLFYGVLSPQEWCGINDYEDNFFWETSEFKVLAEAVTSKVFPICSADFGKNLLDISADISSNVSQPKIFLSKHPRANTIQVFYENTELPVGRKDQGGFWLYNPTFNAVVFHDLAFAESNTSKLYVQYKEDNGNPY